MKGFYIALTAALLLSGLFGQAVQPLRTHLKAGDSAGF